MNKAKIANVIVGVALVLLLMVGVRHLYSYYHSNRSAPAGRTVSRTVCATPPPERVEVLKAAWFNPGSCDLTSRIMKGAARFYYPGGSRVIHADDVLEKLTPVTYTKVEPIGDVEWFYLLCEKGHAIPGEWKCG